MDFFDEFLLGNDGALDLGDGDGEGGRGDRYGVYASGAEFGLGRAGFGSGTWGSLKPPLANPCEAPCVTRAGGRFFFFFEEFLLGRTRGGEPSFLGDAARADVSGADICLGSPGTPAIAGISGPVMPVPIVLPEIAMSIPIPGAEAFGGGSRRPAAAKPCGTPLMMRGGGLFFAFLEFFLAMGLETSVLA